MALRSSSRKIIVVRHAHRDKPLGSAGDNGLSPKGLKQAERVARYFEKHLMDDDFNKADISLISSPKLRCLETLAPLASALSLKVTVEPRLNEGGPFESSKEMARRVRQILDDWRRGKAHTLILCSHGDIIPVLIEEAIGTPVELDKGAWAELELDSANPHGFSLRWLLQRL